MSDGKTSGVPADGRLAFFGLFGVGNIGNEASLAAALAALRRLRPDIQPIVICEWPEWVTAVHHVDAVRITTAGPFDRIARARRPVRLLLWPIAELARWMAALRVARSVQAFIVPGTGILDDFGVKPHEMPFQLFRWSAVARITRRPWSMIGVGAGPIDHPVSRSLMLRTVRTSTCVTYRDDVSRAFMTAIGQPPQFQHVQPDVVFALPRPTEQPRPTPRPAEVGLGLMAYYGWLNDPELGTATLDRYVRSMVTIAARLLDDGFRLRILVGESSDQVAVDAFTDSLRQISGPDWRERVAIEPIDDFSQLLEQVAQTDVVVATRYHNVVAGLMCARPTISIGYAAKFSDLMSSVGLGGYCHDADNIDANAVVSDVHLLVARADEVKTGLTQYTDRFGREVDSVFSEVLVRSRY